MSRALAIIIMATGCVQALPEPGEESITSAIRPGTSPIGDPITIATWNTALTSPWFGLEFEDILDPAGLVFEDHSYEDGRRVGQLVNDSGLDVVALNEVFDEESRRGVEETTPAYPYRVTKLDSSFLDDFGDATPRFEESGLMLLSKKPFQKYTAGVDLGRALLSKVESTAPDRVYFEAFSACSGFDCRAAKGFGIVRVLGSAETQTTYNVVFTHMQADGEGWASRERQFAQIEDGIRRVLKFDTRKAEEYVVMGDLNVNGSLKGDVSWEYVRSFGPGSPLGDFFQKDLEDSWPLRTSPQDFGISHVHGARYDYIFRRADGFTCPQRLMLPTAFGDVSDHTLVATQLAKPATNCAASDPRVVTPASFSPTGHFTESMPLAYRGSQRWIRIEERGSYTITATVPPGASSEAHVDVYRASDLTTPIRPWREIVETGLDPAQNHYVKVSYALSEAPMYIRLAHPDPAYFGNVDVDIQRHGCSNETSDVCFLEANEQPTQPPWPIGTPLNADDTAFFEFESPAVTNPMTTPSKYVEAYARSSTLELLGLKLYRFADDSANDWSNGFGSYEPLIRLRDTFELHGRYLLAVGRSSTSQTPEVGFTTNLTILHGTGVRSGVPFDATLRLVCEDEQGAGAFGSDEDAVRVHSDERPLYEFLVDDVDTHEEPSLQPWIAPFYFSTSAEFWFDEEDDGFFTGADDHFPSLRVDPLPAWDPGKPWSREAVEQLGVRVKIPLEDEYYFVYNLSRHL